MAPRRDWKQVNDPNKKRILEALADEQWEFRTLRGIARDVKMPEHRVRRILRELDDYVRESPLRGNRGERLYRLRSRGPVRKESQKQMRRFIGMRGG